MKKKRAKSDPLITKARVDRRALSVVTFANADDTRAFWQHRSLHARLQHMELLRRINYGSAATGRLQRLLEVVQPKTR